MQCTKSYRSRNPVFFKHKKGITGEFAGSLRIAACGLLGTRLRDHFPIASLDVNCIEFRLTDFRSIKGLPFMITTGSHSEAMQWNRRSWLTGSDSVGGGIRRREPCEHHQLCIILWIGNWPFVDLQQGMWNNPLGCLQKVIADFFFGGGVCFEMTKIALSSRFIAVPSIHSPKNENIILLCILSGVPTVPQKPFSRSPSSNSKFVIPYLATIGFFYSQRKGMQEIADHEPSRFESGRQEE